MVILRDRWYDKHNDFGVKLTNRQELLILVFKKKLENIQIVYPTYQFLTIGMVTYFYAHKIYNVERVLVI